MTEEPTTAWEIPRLPDGVERWNHNLHYHPLLADLDQAELTAASPPSPSPLQRRLIL